jgi:hypothetical protein
LQDLTPIVQDLTPIVVRRIKGERFRVNEFAGLQDLTPAFSAFA